MSKATIKKALLKRRAQLVGEIEERDDYVAQNVIDEEEDKAFERLEDEMLSALSAADRDEVVRIELALEKLAEGSYGICEECGEDIAPERLIAMPDALICINCATAAESARA